MSRENSGLGGIGRLIKIFIVLGVLGGAGYYLWAQFFSAAPVGINYRTSPVTRGILTQVVTAAGQISALVMVQVGSQISGTIEKLNVDFNDPVKEGQIIAELDAATYRAVVAQGEGDLANARAALELARLNAERKKQLIEQKLSPVADYDKAIADLHQAEAVEKMKIGTLQRAQVDLRRCTILAPTDGIVISRKVDVGQTVAASLNAPVLFEIAHDLSQMQIHTHVAEADVGGVEPGQKVDFAVDAFPDRTFHGVVGQVRNSPTTIDNVVTYDTVINVDNADLKLKPGMTANVTIILAEKEDVLLVANAALRWKPPEETPADTPPDVSNRRRERPAQRAPEKKVYFLADGPNAKPELVTITVGLSDGIKSELLSGLKEGQNVVTGTVHPAASGAPNPMGNPFGGGPPRR